MRIQIVMKTNILNLNSWIICPQPYPIYLNNFISLLCGSFLVTGLTVSGIIQVHP
ncbi:MAG: hypothetical protein CLLPBCKN_000262 [Chroococcidiopsis cubana SAG 39.79]|nr:hypothetical protein [Chroococcidiopsis cubana SAG 39.79]